MLQFKEFVDANGDRRILQASAIALAKPNGDNDTYILFVSGDKWNITLPYSDVADWLNSVSAS